MAVSTHAKVVDLLKRPVKSLCEHRHTHGQAKNDIAVDVVVTRGRIVESQIGKVLQ